MRIAIFHDYVDSIGGAEKLVLILAKALNADILTTDVDIDSIKKMGFDDIRIKSIGKTIKRPLLRQISASIKFILCDFHDAYDFFIFSGNWAHFAAKKHKPNLLYCHTPPKAFYETVDWIQNESVLIRTLFKIWVIMHKPIYEYYMNHVQLIVANSKNTSFKIKKFLRRSTFKIIYPPIDCKKYNFQKSDDFWLSVNRLYPEKRIDLQIETFKSIPEETLVIVGNFSKDDFVSKYAQGVQCDLAKNITFYNALDENELALLYSNCKGFISTAKDEDFGMTVVEAMAAGKPVVCVKEGGYLESVIDGITGLLVEPNVEDISRAIKIISKNPQKYKDACIKQAQKFDISVFIKSMKETIQNHDYEISKI